MNSSIIKFAVVGMGHIGKRHAEMIRRHPQARLVAMCDIVPAQQAGIADADVPWFNSIEALLVSDLEVDVVNICTPNGLHARQAILALEARKHVVIEKPMALTKADAEAVIFKALQMSRQVFAVMQNRYSPPSAWLKQLIAEGVLGDIYMVQLNCYWNRDDRYYKPGNWHGTAQLDGGTLFTQFSHFIDTLYWLFGDITNIKAAFGDFAHRHSTDFEDSGTVMFDFVNGGMGCINYSTAVWDKNLESSISIVAERGSVKVAGQYMNDVVYCHVKDYDMPVLAPVNPPNDYGAYKGSAANHHYVIENVVDTLHHRTAISTNALEGLKVVDIIERIYSLKPNPT
ncbi:putative dehydrogenase [Breznakibacter xylanolyticus]|uniref:Putative dehydrogenase n=1 Tax=Breznakibacter xylanolyticus TaxID=990 RepID=A0A2W7NGW5_9BACT|nr:Gfo/Idh/MocA family oxidoreductase [Breznakibacter xylanolyticus]PZX19478.1 putative dehydrogenase [Breznakibacter xylanolyticus]